MKLLKKNLLLIFLFFYFLSFIICVSADEFAGDYNTLRIESEDKLVVPTEQTEEVWNYMVEKLINNKSYLKSLNTGFDSYYYNELFQDTYFDNSNFQLLKNQSSVRQRIRWNLDDPNQEKSGRKLIQVKINDISDSEFNRGELKYEINPSKKLNDIDDLHPVIGLIDKKMREDFKDKISELKVNPYSLKKSIPVEQRRRSLYITLNGGQFMSIRLDEVSSKKLWVKIEYVELEPELNEIPYTENTPEEREKMEKIREEIVTDILKEFPGIKRDLTPKYNKTFYYFEDKIPFFRFLIRNEII